jgi:hypothetical protein
LWLRPHRTKLQNVWQGPYEVVDRALAWHTYTLEREGKRRRATTGQLKRFRDKEAGAEVRFACLTGDSLAVDQKDRFRRRGDERS